jgi:hypothetical protein
MTEPSHPERRRQNPDPARERRMRQREAWEHSPHPETPSTSPDAAGAGAREHLNDAFASALGAVVDAASRLPPGDLATSLQAGLSRISETASRDDARAAVRALVEASHDALREDPWVRVHVAALELDATLRDH